MMNEQQQQHQQQPPIILMSFGHKHGIPSNASKVFDIRHLPGPTKHQRRLTGISLQLRKELFANEEFSTAYDNIKEEVLRYITHDEEDDHNDSNNDLILTFVIGCEEGRHRSVAMVEQLQKDLHVDDRSRVSIVHRDLIDNKQTKDRERKQQRDKKYHGNNEEEDMIS